MATFFSYLKKNKFPPFGILSRILSRPLSWYGLILWVLIISIFITAYVLIIQINNKYLYTIPTSGGKITEGMIGAPHFINPILATSETDIALTKLLFSGLMRQDTSETLTTDLAESYGVSDDGLVYTFNLKKDLKWSDGKTLDSADISFTISKLANPLFNKDPFWQEINVATPDSQTVVFTLPTPQNDFLNKMTIGILPEHAWADISDDSFESSSVNLRPIGNGPFKFKRILKDGEITKEIILKRNPHFTLEKSFLKRYRIIFFNNQKDLLEAINHNKIDITLAATSETATQISRSDIRIEKGHSQANVGLYRLQSEKFLQNRDFVDLIDRSIDKEKIIDKVEHGYGMRLPVPIETDAPILSAEDLFDSLKKIGYVYEGGLLKKNGSSVSLSIAVENNPSTFRAAQELSSELEQLGISTILKAYDRGTFLDGINRNLYPIFFANTTDASIPDNYTEAIVLYTKTYPFIIKNSVQIPALAYVGPPSDQHSGSENWYIKTDKVWKLFLPNEMKKQPDNYKN